MPVRLSAAIVTYRPDPPLLQATLASLANAAARAIATGELASLSLYLVDNGPSASAAVVRAAAAAWPQSLGAPEVISGHGNVGYGRGNNLALERADSDFHLVSNPDVEVDADALRAALVAMREHPGVGIVVPAAFAPDGTREYLCKRHPTVRVLLLRGFAPAALRRRFDAELAHYEMREVTGNAYFEGVPHASGCFLLARTALMKRLRGFDPAYFMYFEDFDLSARASREAAIAYEPAARILHHGGGAARKGLRHIAWFGASALRFFSRHGWRWG